MKKLTIEVYEAKTFPINIRREIRNEQMFHTKLIFGDLETTTNTEELKELLEVLKEYLLNTSKV